VSHEVSLEAVPRQDDAMAPRDRTPKAAPPRPEPRESSRPAVAAPSGVRVVTGRSGVRVVTGPMFIDTSKGHFVERRPPPPPAMSRRAFEQERQRLLREFERSDENPGSISCTGCRQCVSCMFCSGCEECYRCTHSHGCRDSSHLTHCRDCTGCHDCAYCVGSENCTRSSYVILSRSLSDCTYCFGCVGLAKKDFHILNVPYGRTEYFRITRALAEELGLGPSK
jgi:hypothetical protein